MRTAVEEFLRYDSPVHLTARSVIADVEVGDKTIPKGEMAMVLLGAANRDPEVFDDPEKLDVGRTENHHLAFSAGGHFCLGATLARLEAQIAFDALLNRFEKIELAGEPTYRDTITLRGLSSLEVSAT
jgi:cytochrome P450